MIDFGDERYELVVTGDAELERGPLGRFIDLATQIEAEGLTVPPLIADVLDELQAPGINTGETT